MVKKVVTVKADASVKDAITLMNKHEIGCLVVCENQCPVGIITERDLLTRLLTKLPELPQIKVQEIMSQPLWIGEHDMEMEEAVGLMIEQKIKKLPITENGKLVGLVTLTDILRFQPQLIRAYKAFSGDVVPYRMKKVFDYYLLLAPEPKNLTKENTNTPSWMPKR